MVGILPGIDRTAANPWSDVTVVTGIGHARNLSVAASADVVVAVGGGWGTLSEIGARGGARPPGGAARRLAPGTRRRAAGRGHYAASAEEAVERAAALRRARLGGEPEWTKGLDGSAERHGVASTVARTVTVGLAALLGMAPAAGAVTVAGSGGTTYQGAGWPKRSPAHRRTRSEARLVARPPRNGSAPAAAAPSFHPGLSDRRATRDHAARRSRAGARGAAARVRIRYLIRDRSPRVRVTALVRAPRPRDGASGPGAAGSAPAPIPLIHAGRPPKSSGWCPTAATRSASTPATRAATASCAARPFERRSSSRRRPAAVSGAHTLPGRGPVQLRRRRRPLRRRPHRPHPPGPGHHGRGGHAGRRPGQRRDHVARLPGQRRRLLPRAARRRRAATTTSSCTCRAAVLVDARASASRPAADRERRDTPATPRARTSTSRSGTAPGTTAATRSTRCRSCAPGRPSRSRARRGGPPPAATMQRPPAR